MRIIIFSIIIVTTLIRIRPIHAQIKTYDIKQLEFGNNKIGGYRNLCQISPTRILAQAGSSDSRPYLIAINKDGFIEHNWKSNFLDFNLGSIYRYDHQSNTIVYLTTEVSSFDPGAKYQMRLVLLDSNLREKSNIVLDSTITGFPTQFERTIGFKGIYLRDSSILWMSYYYSRPPVKNRGQLVLHISRDGRSIRKALIGDTTGNIIHYPVLHMPSGEILVYSSTYNSKTTNYTTIFRTLDTVWHLSQQSLGDTLSATYGTSRAKYIPTSDSGIIQAYYYQYVPNMQMEVAAVVKYDKNFQKQWETYIPGNNINQTGLYIIESRNGGYYIVTGGTDRVVMDKYPQYESWNKCFQDIVLSHLDTEGKVTFTTYYGTEQCSETPSGLIEDYADGGIIITGSYAQVTYNTPCQSVCREPSYSSWLFKVDSLGEPARRKVVTGVAEQVSKTSEIRLFPNPASGVLTVEFGRTGYFTSIEIVDMNGSIFQTSSVEATADRTNVDISALLSGSYFCRLRAGANFIARPFVIQR